MREARASGRPRLLGGRARMRTLFLRILGAVFFVAFASALVQVRVLVGRDGLLPACRYLDAVARAGAAATAPTVFWLDCGDGALYVVAVAGLLLSLGLIFDVLPRYCLIALWALYLSLVTVGQEFFSFQWDNLLLESAFFALFVTPAGLRSRGAPPPPAAGVFLMLWLVFRLNVESGVAKLASGDPTWRDLTAMVSYYETAPLPTPLAWYAHQLPLWAHRASAFSSLAAELVGSLLVFATRPLRLAAGVAIVAMQLSILLTANYGFFNYLSIALCLFLLDDADLAAIGARWRRAVTRLRRGRRPAEAPPAVDDGEGGHASPAPADAPSARPLWRRSFVAVGVALLVLLTVVPFMPFLGARQLMRELGPVPQLLASSRSINAYHLFAHMTLIRREAVIEGSADGITWLPYELNYKPGDPMRPPPVVAPHQPRVDFQLWFLLLGGGRRAPYFDALLYALARDPPRVRSLFAVNPFPNDPPRMLRVAVYRYRFTDMETGRSTGAWWSRELLGYSRAAGAGTRSARRRLTRPPRVRRRGPRGTRSPTPTGS